MSVIMINPYAKYKNYNKELAHYYWVFEDKEFQELIYKYYNEILKHEASDLAAEELIQEFGDKFELSLGALEDYLEANFSDHFDDPTLTRLSEDPRVRSFRTAEVTKGTHPGTRAKNGEKWITIHFNEKDFSYEQYKLAWPFIKTRLIEESYEPTIVNKPKRSVAENSQLLYAIFKARKKGKTFTEIFNKYCDSNLEYYIGKKPVHDTVKSLQNYYYRHY